VYGRADFTRSERHAIEGKHLFWCWYVVLVLGYCCCFGPSLDSVPSLFAAVDDCAIRKGEDISLRVSCRNDSPATIQRVQVSLYEKITWGTAATNQVDPKTGVCSQSARCSH
jgi:hypothetical protein